MHLFLTVSSSYGWKTASAQGRSVVEAGFKPEPRLGATWHLALPVPKRAVLAGRPGPRGFVAQTPGLGSDGPSGAALPCPSPRPVPAQHTQGTAFPPRGWMTRSNQDVWATRLVFLSTGGRGTLPAVTAGPFVAIGILRPHIMMTNSRRFRPLWQRAPGAGAGWKAHRQHPNTQHRFHLSLLTPPGPGSQRDGEGGSYSSEDSSDCSHILG